MTIHYSSHFAPLDPPLIAEVVALSGQIFGSPSIDYAWRFANMPAVSVFCAWHDGQLIGFKAGYAIAERKYYSWMGAVHPDYRRQGVANHLCSLQHSWLTECHYSKIETSSRSDNDIMAKVNFNGGFLAVGTKLKSHGLQVLWEKSIKPSDA